MTTVCILGPNLPDQSEGVFHVHAWGCADIAKSRQYRSREFDRDKKRPVEIANWEELVLDCYADHLGDDPANRWTDYLSEFKIFPCVVLDKVLDTEATPCSNGKVTSTPAPSPVAEQTNKEPDTMKTNAIKLCHCGCSEQTNGKSNYRQGHDARHVSQLVKSVLAGEQTSAQANAVLDGKPNLQAKLFAGVGNAQAKATKKAASVGTKAAKRDGLQATNDPAPSVEAKDEGVTAKVGRWTYEGTVRNGDFVYASKKDGSPVRVPEGKYTIV